MVHYTTMESQEYGFLAFKVIGATSKKQAQKITLESWEKGLRDGRVLEGPPTICPLFSDLRPVETLNGYRNWNE